MAVNSDEAGQVFRLKPATRTGLKLASVPRGCRRGCGAPAGRWDDAFSPVVGSRAHLMMWGRVFMLPCGHPFCRPDGHPFVPSCVTECRARTGGQGRPQAITTAARSVLDGPEHVAGLARGWNVGLPGWSSFSRDACACSRLRARCGKRCGRRDRG
jgi:hypothetical protein